MESPGEPKEERGRRVDRYRRKSSTATQWVVTLTIVGTLGVFILVVMLVMNAGTPAGPPPVASGTPKVPRPPKPDPIKQAESLPEELVMGPKKGEPSRTRPTVLYGEALREAIEKAYQAAKRRADLYAGQDRWGDAVKAMEQVADRYDDEELRTRCDTETEDLRKRARIAFGARKAEAEKLVDAGKYDEARKVLAGIAETFKAEEYAEPARTRIQELTAREEAEHASRYKQSMAPIEELLANWEFEKALAEVEKLSFDWAKYKALHAGRVARIREVVALKAKMIERVNLARPPLSKRGLRAPGLEGDVIEADAAKVVCESTVGREEYLWTKFGPEASLRLALLCGKSNDPAHRLKVAHLMIEVGYYRRAKAELEKAQELGAKTAADEAELARRQGEGAAKD